MPQVLGDTLPHKLDALWSLIYTCSRKKEESIECFSPWASNRDLCKTPPFAQSLRCVQVLILEIFNIFLWLKSSRALILNEIERFSKVSNHELTMLKG